MTRQGADERLGRLLAIVPWIAAHDGPTVEEVCRRFEVRERDLLADLNLLFLCGVYPFTPDVLIDVNIADGRVWISMADYFRRPLRLNRQEALALVAAGQALLDVPGADADGALATALEKLGGVLGIGPAEALEVELGEVSPTHLELLRSAVQTREKVRIDYYSFGRDARESRVVRPWRVFSSSGSWYLAGWCEKAAGERLFRLDRIASAEATGEHFDEPAPAGAGPANPVPAGAGPAGAARPGAGRTAGPDRLYTPGPADPTWVMDLAPPAHWIAERYPNEGVEERGGGVLRVTLRSGQRAWMERLLLRAGPDAVVVSGDREMAPAAATRLLRRYRRG